jgi:VWFA-related protein
MRPSLFRRHRAATRGVILAVAATIVLSYSAHAQDESPVEPSQTSSVTPEFRDRVEVHLGTIDVTVTARNARVVGGLKKEDFVLRVNDEPQEITNFSVYGRQQTFVVGEAADQSSDATQSLNPQRLEPRPHLIVIFIDNENISRPNRNLFIDRLEATVRTRIRPPTRAMVVTNDMGLRRVGGVTSDPDEILASLQGLIGTTTGGSKVSGHTRMVEAQIRELASKGPTGGIFKDQAMAAARMNSAQIDQAVWRSVDTLKTLIRTISGLPGRKDVIYVSDGIPITPGKETLLLVDELFRVREGIQTVSEIDRTGLFLQVVAYARAADVTIHTVDAAGLQPTHSREAESRWRTSTEIETMRRQNYQAPLLFMAGQTGGLAVVNTNQLEKGLEHIGDATSTYYSLGFPLQSPLANRTHNIKVTLAENPGYELHYRPAFRERTVATRVAERTVTGLLLPVGDSQLEVFAEIGKIRQADEDGWVVPVKVNVALDHLTLLPEHGGLVASVSAFAVAGSDGGATSTVHHSNHTIRLPEGRPTRPTSVAIEFEIESNDQAKRLSIGLLDETSGAARFTVANVEITG